MRRTVLTVMALDLRRLGRDRLALFFVFVLPFVLIGVIGAVNPGGELDATVAVIDRDGTTVATRLVAALRGTEGLDVSTDLSRDEAERDVRIGRLDAVVVIPEGFAIAGAGASAAGGSGGGPAGDDASTVAVIADRTSSGAALVGAALDDAIDALGRELTVQRELARRGVTDPAGAAARAVDETATSTVQTRTVGSGAELSVFAFAAGGQMILFMFINSLTAGSMLIEMRRFGVLDRIRAGPVRSSDVVLGLGLSRFLLACTLAGLILVFAAVAYDVSWGDPLVVAAVVILFGLVSAGASTLLGTLFDKPDSAVGVGVPVGLGMAALGGCMFPLFLAPAAMQVAARIFTPHAWAITALMDSSFDGAGVAEVWLNLVVLAAWAAVLLGLAGFSTRRFSR